MKKYILLAFILITTPLFPQNLELLYYTNTEQIIRHTGYVLKYNEQYEQVEWIAYQLSLEEVNGKIVRSNRLYITGGNSSQTKVRIQTA